MTYPEQLTKNLADMIKASGKSKLKIAHELGLSQNAIHQYTTGRAFPKFENIRPLCKALDCTYEDLLDPH